MRIWCASQVFNYLLTSIFQSIITLSVAFIVYYLALVLAKQVDVTEEYFPFGHRLLNELQDSNRHRLKIADDYLRNTQIDKLEVI